MPRWEPASALPELYISWSPTLPTLLSVLRQALHSTHTEAGLQGWGKRRETTGNQTEWEPECVRSPGSPGCSRTAWEREAVRLRDSQPALPDRAGRSQKLSLAEQRNRAASRSPKAWESQRAVKLWAYTRERWADRQTDTKTQRPGGYCVCVAPSSSSRPPSASRSAPLSSGLGAGACYCNPHPPHWERVLGPACFLLPPTGSGPYLLTALRAWFGKSLTFSIIHLPVPWEYFPS